MSKVEMMCYKKLDEMFNDIDRFITLAYDRPDKFKLIIYAFQGACSNHGNSEIFVDSNSRAYASRDLSAKIIRKYGIYNAFSKAKEMQDILESYKSKYLPLALSVIILEIQEVLETFLILKLPKLLELAAQRNVDAIIGMLNNEDIMPKVLGDDGNPNDLDSYDQISLFADGSSSKSKRRYDMYLRYDRKISCDDFLGELVHSVIGQEDFSKLMGDLILLITSDDEKFKQVNDYTIPTLMSLAERGINSRNQDGNLLLGEPNTGQITLEDETFSRKLNF